MDVPNLTDTLIKTIMLLLSIYIPTYMFLMVITKRKYWWDIFTRMVSMVNAAQCIYIVFRYVLPTYDDYYQLLDLGDDEYMRGLYRFTAYLLVDGIFYIPQFVQSPTVQMFTTISHHFVGGAGIFFIASERKGLGLAAYFAWTEISTPLLHLSWVLYINRIQNTFSTLMFSLFYIVFTVARICTIPLLLMYIQHNGALINALEPFQSWMVYLGSCTLMGLNLIWFIMLTRKVSKIICPIFGKRKQKEV